MSDHDRTDEQSAIEILTRDRDEWKKRAETWGRDAEALIQERWAWIARAARWKALAKDMKDRWRAK